MASATPAANGLSHHKAESESLDLSQVVAALEAVYDGRSSNDVRQAASSYLESVKRTPGAPEYGFRSAIDKSQPAALRHYGLSILEAAIKYGWEDCSNDQTTALRQYVIRLAVSVDDSDPIYLRNKVAQLYVDLAKRAWGTDWMDMDGVLVSLWDSSTTKKFLVLYILEVLSEDIFNRDDLTAVPSGIDLAKACVEIFTPATVLADHFPHRDTSIVVRHGDEGWIRRLCGLLEDCLSHDFQHNEEVHSCTLKTLSALRPLMSWIMPKAISSAHCIERICKGIVVSDVKIQTVSLEVLLAVYNRTSFHDAEFLEVVCPMYTTGSITMLKNIYSWSCTNPDNYDEQKYGVCKKVSELLSSLASHLERGYERVPGDKDLHGFYDLLLEVLSNPSLVVSIPVLHSWARLLRHPSIRDSAHVTQSIGPLLETCSHRLVRYEALPEDPKNATLHFLNEDIDTVPERHAFLGNYRRYCVDVVEVIVRKTPIEALHHILGQAENLFLTLYDGNTGFEASSFTKNSIPVLRVDAQITVIDAALKGYLKWVSNLGEEPQQNERDHNGMQDFFENWCRNVMRIEFQDPEIRRRIVQLMASFAVKVLSTRPSFAVAVLEFILSSNVPSGQSLPSYVEAVKNMQYSCVLELHKLAMCFPDYFWRIYDDLERKVNEIMHTDASDDRQRLGHLAFLFIVIHRASEIESSTRQARLESMLKPVFQAWQHPQLTESLSSFPSFCEMLGFAPLFEYISSRRFGEVDNWSTQPLDSEGQAMQNAILSRFQQLPLRITKTLLAASTDRVREGTRPYETTCGLWTHTFPSILPNLLQFVSHAQAFYNMENWSQLPPELQVVMRKLLTDRFWQAGISGESRDEFYARVGGTRSTFDGFASTVRGAVRQIRESCYSILYSMSKLGHDFYRIHNLPGPLSEALFQNANALSGHHISVLLNMSVPLIEGCPPDDRSHFLPPVVTSLVARLNDRITSEWTAISKQRSEANEGDDLGDEMKTESILRQLTYSTVMLVSTLLDKYRSDDDEQHSNLADEETMRTFVLSCPPIIECLLTFCRNALGFHDTRANAIVIRILRMTISHFHEPSPVRNFICCDMLQASITSLHDPYFIELQRDLAGLIAHIVRLDKDGVARSVILSLPGLGSKPEKVGRAIEAIMHTKNDRQQRAVVLDLLSSVRGVSIHEQGRIKPAEPRKSRPSIQEQYMKVDEQPRIERGGSPELTGVSDMFG